MTTALHGFNAQDTARLEALRKRVHRVYPDPANRYTDYLTACWVAFWRFLDLPEMRLALDGRSEWAGELVDVTFGSVTDEQTGIMYTKAHLRDCVTAYGMTREQALINLDLGVQTYIDKLEQLGPRSSGPHCVHQLQIMHTYLMQRVAGCPCSIDPCQCVLDDPAKIAHEVEV